MWRQIRLYFRFLTGALTANFASALVIELRRGSLPDNRDFLRFKFKNGTDEDFNNIHVFEHKGDIPLTEFIYRVEVFVCLEYHHGHVTQDYLFSQGAAIDSNNKWMKVCGASSTNDLAPWGMPSLPLLQGTREQYPFASAMCGALVAALFMATILVAVKFFKRSRRGRIALRTSDVSTLFFRYTAAELLANSELKKDEGSLVLPTTEKNRPVHY